VQTECLGSSSDETAAVVLAWFPKARTRGCTIECDVTYFMASVDPLDDNKGFAEEQHADFPLLSDPTKKAAEAYGVAARGSPFPAWTVDRLHCARRIP
jgi:peroxiredoxin